MKLFSRSFFQTYLLPGFVFQSLIIGGGYGTGREIVEFFLSIGPWGGLIGMALSTAVWSLVLALSFELARLSKAFDYRTFIDSLLGKGWILYEVVYLLGMILVISVLGSAAGALVESIFGINPLFGIVFVMLAVAALAFYGTGLIEKVLSFWSIGLYVVYGLLIIMCIAQYGSRITQAFADSSLNWNWVRNGIEYSAYNVGILPAILFVVRHLQTRKQAYTAGAVAGVIGMVPGVFIFLAMVSQYPLVLAEEVPADYVLSQLNYPVFTLLFQVILFGTFIETGVGLVHGFNERISHLYEKRQKKMPGWFRAMISLVILTISVFVADAIGIIDLIAKGYKILTWGYMLAFVIPVLTLGWIKIKRSAKS